MELLLNHWHCIIPAIAILAALFLMRNRDDVSTTDKEHKGKGREC